MTTKQRYGFTKKQALNISLEMWKSIEKNKTRNKPTMIYDIFELGCPLCEKYNLKDVNCKGCPLKPKDESIPYGCCKEYFIWASQGNATPMVNRLKLEIDYAKR